MSLKPIYTRQWSYKMYNYHNYYDFKFKTINLI